jgi:murein DD-endopeptidase MepM/ murein hydrolase activator NlpD
MPLRVFPVATPPGASYSDDFSAPRSGGRSHQGNDLFAADGTPVLAPDDGNLRFAEDPIGGHSFYLKADDGTTYYGTHLSGYEGVGPRRAQAGEVVAYVGHGGNAEGTASHLHFEVHPNGGPAVDPFSLLNGAERRPALGAASSSLARFGPMLAALALLGGAAYVYTHPRAVRRLVRRFA